MTGAEVFPNGPPSASTVGRTLAEMSIVSRACELIPHIYSVEHHSYDDPIDYLADDSLQPSGWRAGPVYHAAMAEELSYMTLTLPETEKAIKAKLAHADETIDIIAMPHPKFSSAIRRQDYISGVAGYDALERVGWISKGSLVSAVRAAYLHRQAEALYAASDDYDMYPDRQTVANTNRALRSYAHRVDHAFRYAPYVELVTLMFEGKVSLELNGRHDSLIGHWWTQLSEDLRKFRNATV